MGWSQHHRNGLIYYAPHPSFRGGYTLTTNVGGKWANLLDMDGQVCHRWHLNEGIEYARLLPYGTLLARTGPAEDAGGAERIGGSSTALVELGRQHRLELPQSHAAPRLLAVAQREHPDAGVRAHPPRTDRPDAGQSAAGRGP